MPQTVEDVLKKLEEAETEEEKLAIEKAALEQSDNGLTEEDPKGVLDE